MARARRAEAEARAQKIEAARAHMVANRAAPVDRLEPAQRDPVRLTADQVRRLEAYSNQSWSKRRRLPPRLPKKHEYCLAVAEWARHFKVPAPTVRMRAGRANTDYVYYRNERLRPWISMASTGIHSGRNVLIHEFAHHLDYQSRKYDIGHDRVFFATLVQVATFVLGRPEDYDWPSEYRTIRRWASEQGLTTTPVPARVKTTLEQRQAARAKFLDDHYRDYRTVLERSAPNGSAVYIFTKPGLAHECFLLAFERTAARPRNHYLFETLRAAKLMAQGFLAVHSQNKSERAAAVAAFTRAADWDRSATPVAWSERPARRPRG